jgi:geranylgeranyl pyrophosphate synthase
LVKQLEEEYGRAAAGDEMTWEQSVTELVAELRASPAIEAARREALMFLDRARANLATLPDNVYKYSMLDLCDFVVQRTY